ncbi:MAG: hypothetical protein ACMUIA_04060 [bacterium]
MKGKMYLTLLALPWLCIAAISLSAFGMEGWIEIRQTSSTTFPICIDRPGNYVLLSNLMMSKPAVPCILITADDVILDLQGQNLIGPDGGEKYEGSAGIQVSGNTNITVKNGTVKGFFYGVCLSGGNHEIACINACGNNTGIKAEFSTVTHCTGNDNVSQGIEAKDCNLINCKADQNGTYGLKAESCTIIGCTAEQNGSHGLYSLGKCRVEECTLKQNGKYGLYLSQGHSYAVKNVISDNVSGNIYLDDLHYLSTSNDESCMHSDLISETTIAE